MKKLLLISFFFIFQKANAQTTIRVVNGQNLQTVMDAAADNSIIIIEGGNYGNISFNKPLKLYGTGYFLDGTLANTGLQASVATSIINSITFNTNSSNSEIHGLTTNDIQVSSNQISIYRTKFGMLNIGSAVSNFNNTLLKQNLFTGFTIHPNCLNIVFNNNIIRGNGVIGGASTSFFTNNTFVDGSFITDAQGNPGIFKSNIFFPSFTTSVCNGGYFNFFSNTQNYLINNVFGIKVRCGCGGCSEESFGLNDFSATNKVNQNFSVMYISPTPDMAPDARYQLAPNSPAKGAGEGGTDAGAFGGDEPYVLSGIPSIPSIYQLSVPNQVPQNGILNIQIKAKTNN
ncbi:MAG: hypothetical protein CFE21_18320 [Bacteroidetes bacterium B1(2017)]|nr:MAG: hypothetical protein CFE21_18320 [Bacteroidetes bacterium B1(2017)]